MTYALFYMFAFYILKHYVYKSWKYFLTFFIT